MNYLWVSMVAVAVAAATLLRDRLGNMAMDVAARAIRTRRNMKTAAHIAEPDQVRLTSRFATTRDELNIVLELRRAFFGSSVIVPDASYRECWRRNHYSMKIVYYLNKPLGYWSVIPIDEATFRQAVLGHLSHEEMLTKSCMNWHDVKRGDTYLYVVGAVVPPWGDPNETSSALLQRLLSAYVILDSYAFAAELIDHVEVRGVCGYPSKTGGYELMERTEGFKKTPILINGDPHQPLFVLEGADVPRFKDFLKGFIAKPHDRIPEWDAQDRREFLASLPPS